MKTSVVPDSRNNVPKSRNKTSTLPESKRGSLAKLAKRILTYSVEHQLGDRLQVLLYGVVEGTPSDELQRRLGVELVRAKLAFEQVTGEDVEAVAERLLEPPA